MKENVSYDIEENSSPTESIDIAELIAEIDEKHDIVKDKKRATGMPSDIYFALEIEYNTNYTVKSLGQILDYYEISKRKLRKDEMVQMLIMFEEDPENIEIVEKRKRMWSYVNELKEDKYFSKYIIFST
jgi:hypothetical protein|tara:strand:- start:56 stop:442 length:387 start_codon:yes stop_codon:yes gene_type:complete